MYCTSWCGTRFWAENKRSPAKYLYDAFLCHKSIVIFLHVIWAYVDSSCLTNMSPPHPVSVWSHHFSSNNLDFESRWCNTLRWNQSSAAHHMVSLAHLSSELSYDQSAVWSDLSEMRNVPLMKREKRWGERQTLPCFCLTEAIEERHTHAPACVFL